ncbi:MAG: adenosylcobalamin-dependent ribonucleoside-diphosphate reductase [Chloroflexi bacterium]|nr:adenosylcobalamin-dependent ribonucleoside-diphosphate reductase [Chloroflexota bacterium]
MTTLNLTENALTVLQARYLLGDETPERLFRRVARAVAEAEPPEERAAWEETFYEMMASTKFMPNSPTLFNAGTGKGTLSACFVIPVEDTMESIMQAATTSAMIQKYGGGIGYAFSKLRPVGSAISSTQGRACGAVAVLKMMSSLSDMITQGGKRHGANMGILHVSHPEILDFIHMKDDDVTAQNFNISIAVTDAFMEAVENDREWQLIEPSSGDVVETLPARRIWDEIVQSAWKTGDPGLYFIDESNRTNPTPHLGNLDSTNPCGEVPLLAHEACNLASIDLGKFVVDGHFDFAGLEEMTRKGARFLDDVVTVNKFPAIEVQEAVAATRKTGLGVMGWHDAIIQLGIPYESVEALELADRVMGTINRVAREVSLELAKERGPYPACREDLPIRNATRTCIAPTGTISAIAAASSGIEPIFALAFVKNVLDGKQLREVNRDFERIARERGFYSEEMMDEVAKTGSCQHLEQVPEDVKALFKVANEIKADAHVKMQAVFQKHTDLAVSKTINMANSATATEVENAYWMSYRGKCKGITIYRDGSKSAQVLEVGQSREEAPKTAEGVLPVPRGRPLQMRGITERIRTGHGNTYVTVNFDEENRPFEVFTTLGKAGSCDSASLEAISRLVSLALRSGIRTDQIVEQLQGITCHPVWDQGVQVRSAPDAMALALKRNVMGEAATEMDLKESYGEQLGLAMRSVGNGNGGASRPACPECGTETVFQEGCQVCQACAWNQCGG